MTYGEIPEMSSSSGSYQYLVKWRVYPDSENSWEFEIPLRQNCPYAVDVFEHRVKRHPAVEKCFSPIVVGDSGFLLRHGQNRGYRRSRSIACVITQLDYRLEIGVFVPKLSFKTAFGHTSTCSQSYHTAEVLLAIQPAINWL